MRGRFALLAIVLVDAMTTDGLIVIITITKRMTEMWTITTYQFSTSPTGCFPGH